MVRPKLLSLIALGLTLSVYTLVQSLETGYAYTNERAIGNDQLCEDLRCGYMFGWYTHMRMFKIILGKPYNTELKGLVSPISSTSNVVRSQIVSLFGLKAKRIGAMWALYLFTGLIASFYQRYPNPTNTVETLGYVVDKLQADLTGCRPDNSFDSYGSVLKSLGTSGPGYYKTTILAQHLDEANLQLRKNDIISDDRLRQRLEMNTQIHTLFLHNLGKHERIKYDLQNMYNLKMNWNDSSAVLHTVWANARHLDWANTNLYPIKMYYNACFDFFEIILVRLSLKHMTYLQDYSNDSDTFLRYAQEWHNIVVQFSTMLKLSDDLHVNRLLDNLKKLIGGTKTLANVVDFLVETLNTLCEPFGCDAGNEFVIDNREFTIPYTSLIGEQIKFPEKTTSNEGIEYNSLENAKAFLSHLKLAFGTVNFSVIWSLTDYIDELNPTRGV